MLLHSFFIAFVVAVAPLKLGNIACNSLHFVQHLSLPRRCSQYQSQHLSRNRQCSRTSKAHALCNSIPLHGARKIPAATHHIAPGTLEVDLVVPALPALPLQQRCLWRLRRCNARLQSWSIWLRRRRSDVENQEGLGAIFCKHADAIHKHKSRRVRKITNIYE